MRVTLIGLFGALLLVAACETTPEESATATGEGAATESAPAPTMEVAAVEPTGPVPGSSEDFVVNVGDRVFFDYDKSVLKPQDFCVSARKQFNRLLLG